MTHQALTQPIERRRGAVARGRVDRTLPLIVALLLMCGLTALFSATYYQAIHRGDPLLEVKRQLIGVGLGLGLMLITMRVPYAFWGKPSVAVTGLALSVALLVIVLVPGIGVYRNGSRRWLNLAGLSFQPSELAKLAVVNYLATTLAFKPIERDRFLRGVLPLLIIPAIFFLLILQQPNLSTAGSVLIVSLLFLLMAGVKWRHLAVLGVSGLAVGFAYAWSAPYRRERLLSFRDPFAQMSDDGYQLAQSLIAIGSGGLFGRGLGQGRQKFSFLPYPESDFIFAIVGEDFGLFGCVVVISLFVALLLAGMRIALNCPDRFGCFLAAGITAMISVQAFINIGVVAGVLPTTGLPLPFFSAGGTSVTLLLGAVGIVLNVSRGRSLAP